MKWVSRSQKSGVRSQKPEASRRVLAGRWATIALLLVNLLGQAFNYVKSDLKPLLDSVKETNEAVNRIETRLRDHEERIRSLENKSETEMGKKARAGKRDQDSQP